MRLWLGLRPSERLLTARLTMTERFARFPLSSFPARFPEARIVMCALAAFESDLCIEIH